jgi:hypothetical protein
MEAFTPMSQNVTSHKGKIREGNFCDKEKAQSEEGSSTLLELAGQTKNRSSSLWEHNTTQSSHNDSSSR